MTEVIILSGADADLDEIYEQSEQAERILLELDRKLTLLRSFPKLMPATFLAKVRKVRLGERRSAFSTRSKGSGSW